MSGSKIITNPSGAYGYTDLEQRLPQTVGEFEASADIDAKSVVQLAADGTVATAGTSATASLCIGVASRACGDGDTVGVITSGIATAVPYTGSDPSAGDLLAPSGATAGSVVVASTPGAALGVAVGAGSDGVVNVWVSPSAVVPGGS